MPPSDLPPYGSTPPPLPLRPHDGHKGIFGRILLLGGCADMIGAPALAGLAALRCGSGLVRVAAPRAVLPAILTLAPEMTGLGLGAATQLKPLLDAAENADALIVGPGLGQSPAAKTRVLRLIRLPKPMVVDADALNIISLQKNWPAFFQAHAVLTPHPGEMKRLARFLGRTDVPADQEGRIGLAIAAAKAFGQVIVLKGHRTVVSDGTRLYVNTTGDSTLSKAGSGDVLSGILGCLLGQKMPPFDAACLAAHLHGKAGEIAGQRCGTRCALARDVIDAISPSIAQHGG